VFVSYLVGSAFGKLRIATPNSTTTVTNVTITTPLNRVSGQTGQPKDVSWLAYELPVGISLPPQDDKDGWSWDTLKKWKATNEPKSSPAPTTTKTR
jgi:hypothetical protein